MADQTPQDYDFKAGFSREVASDLEGFFLNANSQPVVVSPEAPSLARRRFGGRLRKLARLLLLPDWARSYLIELKNANLFDRVYYRESNQHLHFIYRLMPERHYILYGESEGRQPNSNFDPQNYLRLNPDVPPEHPFLHFINFGRAEGREYRGKIPLVECTDPQMPAIRPADFLQKTAPVAVVLHLYYYELWDEISVQLHALDFEFDLYVTLTNRADLPHGFKESLRDEFPNMRLFLTPNRGRDILPFITLVNSGILSSYQAIAKIHGKRSLHRVDGDLWRQHLISGILKPGRSGRRLLEKFLSDRRVALLVADGQIYEGDEWWGCNKSRIAEVLARIEVDLPSEPRFPAGSIYWIKQPVLELLHGLQLEYEHFDPECGQVDGTLAHALERIIGPIVGEAGMKMLQVSELTRSTSAVSVLNTLPARPNLVSAFYLPQFHPIELNDHWWGKGYTEWHAVAGARPNFRGHCQPIAPTELGYYDLRVADVMAEQAQLARAHKIDAFCVYHYWFDPDQPLSAPMKGLLQRKEIDFPFYLAWANESWRRNWDGLSGEIIIEQRYQPGFEERFARSVIPYMQDHRYLRPDGVRPRLIIYRPGEFPEPEANIGRLRSAFERLGIGEVELGGVIFHLEEERNLSDGILDFWVEMPPHGVVTPELYLHGGEEPQRFSQCLAPGFRGLIYDYRALARRHLRASYRCELPSNTIPGVMPSWDNTARRGAEAHIAWGANPGQFAQWVEKVCHEIVPSSYRRELFVNSWNEWGERAMLEPSQQYGKAWLNAFSKSMSE